MNKIIRLLCNEKELGGIYNSARQPKVFTASVITNSAQLLFNFNMPTII